MFNTVILVVNAVDALLPSHNLQHKGSRGNMVLGLIFCLVQLSVVAWQMFCTTICSHWQMVILCTIAPCGLRGCKNWPTPFPGRMLYKATKPGLVSVLYLSMCYTVLLFIRTPFYVSLVYVAMCSVFWLFWLCYQYLPSDWLERLLWGSLIVARGSSPKSPGRTVRMIFLVYCIASLFYLE